LLNLKDKPYNPYQDGPVACIWELCRRNSLTKEIFFNSDNDTTISIEPAVKRVLIDAFCSLTLRTEEEFVKLLSSKWPKLNPTIKDKLVKTYIGEKDLVSYNPIKIDLAKLLSLDDHSLRSELNALLSKDLTFIGVYPTVFDSKSRKVFVDRMWSLISGGEEISNIRTSVDRQIREMHPHCSAADLKKISSKATVTNEVGEQIKLKPKISQFNYGSEQSWAAFIWDEYFKSFAPKSERIPASGKRLIKVIRRIHNLPDEPESSFEINSRVPRTESNIRIIEQLIHDIIRRINSLNS
jgi:hypothetical protein